MRRGEKNFFRFGESFQSKVTKLSGETTKTSHFHVECFSRSLSGPGVEFVRIFGIFGLEVDRATRKSLNRKIIFFCGTKVHSIAEN